MMEGALTVSELSVGDVMVPRSQMVMLAADEKLIDLMKHVVESGHSRFPVHGDDKDEILGVLLAKDLLRGVVADNGPASVHRSEEHTSELQSLMRISYAVFCLKKKKQY